MLLTQKQWNQAVARISKKCDKSLITSLQTRHQRVERHFATDYTGCQGSKDLGSEPVNKYVSLDIYGDFVNISEGQDFNDLFDVTPLVELANGETLSDSEASGGLGTFAPKVSAPEKLKVREDHVRFRIEGRGEESGDGAKSKRIAGFRES